jgi:acyl dehydratase
MNKPKVDDSSESGTENGYGILTDAGIARLRQRIGIPYNRPTAPHNYEVTWDGTRHFAYGYGDENPLWCDRHYGEGTRWGGLIAPPTFLYTLGEPDAPPLDAAQKALLKGDPLIGIGSYQAAMEFEWWQPLRLGNRVKQRAALVGVREHPRSEFSGRTVSETKAYVYRNQDSEIIAVQRGTWIRAERHKSARSKKKVRLPEPYSQDQLAAIDSAYESERMRGADTLFWEDVEVGSELPTIVRGPLRTSDLIVWHIGWGMQLTPPGAFRLSYKIRKKVPGMYTVNSLNVPDTVQRLHWEQEWANQLGIPLIYDYGGLRETFLVNIITNWMGDEGWLWKLSCQHRKFVYTGDTYWIKGKVVEKSQEAGRNEVKLELAIENQWGEVVTPGNAVVLLPSRSGRVSLPTPFSSDIDELYRHEIDRSPQ